MLEIKDNKKTLVYVEKRSVPTEFKVFKGSEEKFIKKDYIEKMWFLNKVLHRDGGPAVIWKNGRKEWRQNGKPHRTDGPAVIFSDGSEQWHQDGNPFRHNGPALIIKMRDITTLRSYYFLKGESIDIQSFFPIKKYFLQREDVK